MGQATDIAVNAAVMKWMQRWPIRPDRPPTVVCYRGIH